MEEVGSDNSNEEVLHCKLHSFTDLLSVEQIDDIFPNPGQREIAIKNKDDSVALKNLTSKSDGGKDRSSNLTDVQKFSWRKFTNGEHDSSFCVLDKVGNIYLYAIQNEEPQLCHVCNRETLQSVLQNSGVSTTGTIECATWLEDSIILYLNGFLVIISVFDRTFEFLYKINVVELRSEVSALPGYQIIPGYVAVYQQEKPCLLLFDVITGELVIEIDLQGCSFPVSNILMWKLSTDAAYLVLLTSDFVIHHLSLREYINSFPSRLKTHNCRSHPYQLASYSRSYSTCEAGDITWRNKLHHMHNTKLNKLSNADSGGSVRANISGFRKSSRHREDVEPFHARKVLLLLEKSAEYKDIVVNSHYVSLLFRSTMSHEWYFCYLDVEKESYMLQSFTGDHFVVLCDNISSGHLVFSNTHLMSLVLNLSIQQEELVNKLMLYSGATTADIICHLNQWGRCSIPLHTLEVGLRHRQLDTVSFFMKSKENLFSSLKQKKQDVSASLPNDSYYDNLVQIEPAINLLVEAIKENIVEQHISLFASKLLSLTLEFLYGLLRDALIILREDDANRRNLDKCVETIMNLVSSVRQCMKKQSETAILDNKDSTDGYSENIYHPPFEEQIEDKVNRSQLLYLQSHLYVMNQKDVASLTSIKDICFKKAIRCLYNGEEETAVSLLENLGYNVTEKLWEVATYSHNWKLRNIVIEILKKMDALTSEQKEMLDFVDQLNKVYPCRSFSKALSLLNKGENRLSASKVLGTEEEVEVEVEKDIIHEAESIDDSVPMYCEVLFDWIKWWNEETKQKILLEGHMLRHEQVGRCTSSNEELIWKYLLSHNMIQELLEWIDHSFDLKYEDGGSELIHSRSICDIALPRSNVDSPHLYMCTEYTRNLILKRFAKHGIFSSSVMEEFHKLLQYVSANGNLLESPHPLTGCTGVDLSDFHRNFIQYCAINNLTPMLWEYCDVHEISIGFLNSCTENVCKTVHWFPFFIQMYSLCKNPKDADSMVQASLANAALVWEKPIINSGDLIKNDHVIAALATEMYSTYPINQITGDVQSIDCFGNIGSSELENAVSKYPKLHAALFSGFSSEKPLQDINFYQLLTGNAPFDTSRLFGWQSTNTTTTEECVKEIPHFSRADLVKKYSSTESIKHTYYLKQGRPSFAVASFLAEEFNTGHTTLTSQRAHLALNTALVMAAKYFNNIQKSSTAVMFVEMLGQDSISVRMIINVGQVIYQHRQTKICGNLEGRKGQLDKLEEEIGELLLDCVYNKKVVAYKVLSMLENAVNHNIDADNMQSTSFEASQRWTLTVLFCHLMKLPLTKCYLEKCAQADQWLQFLWFAQAHQYPSDQLQTVLHNFRSHSLREHLYYVIENVQSKLLLTPSPTKKNTETRTDSHDIRSSLYSRIGVAKDRETGGESSSDEEEIPSMHTETTDEKHLLDEDFTVNPETVPDDVFSIIFQCQSYSVPWKHLLVHAVVLRNPLLAELGACYKDSVMLACLCGWLISMMDETEHSKMDSIQSCWKWSYDELEKLCDVYTRNDWGYTLATGFDIFVQGSPLIPFLEFAAEVRQRRNYKLCEEHLDKFKEEMNSFIHKKSTGVDDPTLLLYGRIEWLERTVYRILQHIITQNGSVYDTLHTLRLIDQTNMSLLFSIEVPDFSKLHKIAEIIHRNEVTFDLSTMWNISSPECIAECQKAIKLMMGRNLYSEAVSLAQLASLPTDEITLDQLRFEQSKIQSTSLWKSKVVQRNFWNQCSQLFKENGVAAKTAMDYFQRQVVNIDDYKEKAYLYSVMVDCLTSYRDIGETKGSLAGEFYHEMWLYKIKAKVQEMETTPDHQETIDELFHVCEKKAEEKHPPDRKELLHFGKMPSVHPDDTESTFTPAEQTALDILIKDLLKEGKISDSCRVAALFDHSCQDLAIILVCIRLSIAAITIREIDPDIRMLLTMESPKSTSLRKSHSVASFRQLAGGNMPCQSSSTVDFLPADKEEIVSTMESLLRHCNEGHQCCLRVITMYKIACILGMRYEDLVLSDEFSVLGALLKTSLPQRFYLAKDFLTTGCQNDSVVSGYLSEEILKTYKKWAQNASITYDNSTELSENRELLFSPADKKSVFEQLVKLCQDPSVLGDKLLESAAHFSGESEESQSELTIQTELLIMAHECHTIACNMEGISKVLRAARVCASCLTNAGEFALMVRLLTGIGRFSEMTYIFDALIQHHQFELLLKKGMEKEDKLKIAMLDYLKRYHKSDSETYTMVALNFTMHREIAQMLEECAQTNLNSLKKKTLDNSSEIQATLKKIVQYYTDAAESYVKDSCIRHAHQCIRQARLVALQTHHLSPLIQVINLSNGAVKHVISCHTKFTESYIISEAYGQRECWPAALTNNVINNGDMKYLQEFRSYIKITPVLIADTISKYHQSPEKSAQAIQNITKLLHLCKDVKMQLKVAQELGMRDFISTLMKGDAGKYLRDITHT